MFLDLCHGSVVFFVTSNVFPESFLHLEHRIHDPVELRVPSIPVVKRYGLLHQDAACLAIRKLPPVKLDSRFLLNLILVTQQAAEQFLVIVNVEFDSYYVTFLDLCYCDVTSR